MEATKKAKKEYDSNSFARPNLLTAAKLKTTILEERLVLIQQSKLAQGFYREDAEGNAIVNTSAAEFKKLLSVGESGQFYTSLKKAAQKLNEAESGYYDIQENRFKYDNLVGSYKYENSILETTFRKDIKELFITSKDSGKYTLVPINLELNWKSLAATKLYPQLKMKAFYRKDYDGERNGEFSIEFDINELKLTLGAIDPNQEEVKEVLIKIGRPDYRAACKLAKKKAYINNSNFIRDYINPAIKEITENADSDIKAELLKDGTKLAKGEISTIFIKVTDKNFVCAPKDNDADGNDQNNDSDNGDNINQQDDSNQPKQENVSKDTEELSLFEKRKFENKILSVLEPYITNEEQLTEICKAGSYNEDYIKNQVEYLKNYKSEVGNTYRFLLGACKNNYAGNTIKKPASKNVSQFCDIMQQDYDFDAIEKALHDKIMGKNLDENDEYPQSEPDDSDSDSDSNIINDEQLPFS